MEFCSVSVFMEANRGRGKIIIAIVDSRVVDDVIIVCFQWRDNRGGAPPPVVRGRRLKKGRTMKIDTVDIIFIHSANIASSTDAGEF